MTMRFWMISAMVMVFLCGTTYGFELTPSVVGNDQFIKGFIGAGDPNAGLVGPYATWNDMDSENVWAAGLRGQYDISGTMQAGISKILPVPASWWEALEALKASGYIGVEVGVCNLTGAREAEATPLIGARLGPLVAEVGYSIFEGGQVKTQSGTLAESGLTWWIGLQWPLRF
jgi:hypothetical protein